MARPKIRPISAEAAAAGQAALDSFNSVVTPPGALEYPTKQKDKDGNALFGKRWGIRASIEKAHLEVGGTKEEPNESVAVFYLLLKTLPFNVDPDKAVPVGTKYHVRHRLDYDKLDGGDDMAVRAEAVLTSLFAALGANAKEGLAEDMIGSAFPEKGSDETSTLLGHRVVATLSLNPPKDGRGTGFLNVDRFAQDVEV